jgi:hypothetical protein
MVFKIEFVGIFNYSPQRYDFLNSSQICVSLTNNMTF